MTDQTQVAPDSNTEQSNSEESSTPTFRVTDLPEKLSPMREEFLANVAMLAQIPSATGGEDERVQFMLDRFVEAGLPEVGRDERGNAVGFLPGQVGDRTVMLVAHLDTWIPVTVDHNVVFRTDRVIGPGVEDNALGAAVVSMIPTVLQNLGIQLDSNLVLLGSVSSLHKGNHEGVRWHLEHSLRPIDFGIVVEGIKQGRLNFVSIGAVRGDITCHVRDDARRYGYDSALIVLNQIINRIMSIELPSRPYTHIRLGWMKSGEGVYNTEPDDAALGFEVVSHSAEMIERVMSQITDIVEEMSAHNAVTAKLDAFFHREGGGVPFSHPLIKSVVRVMGELGIEPDDENDPSEHSEFVAQQIPVVTLGITHVDPDMDEDHVLIEPMLTGVAQVVGVLADIDRGACDER